MVFRARRLGGLASATALVVLALSCRDPTEMMVRITTNAPCDQLDVSINVGPAGEAPGGEAAARTGCRDPSASPAYVGSIALVPSGRDVPLTLRIVAGVGRSAASCLDAFGKGCIVARRTLRYVAHSTLTLPVLLDTQCDGQACSDSTTCVLGKCVDSTLDPNGCLSPGGCTPPLPDAGGPDASPDASSVQIAHISAKGDTTCAVFTDGTVRCWGRNDVRQLGFSGSASCGTAACERKPVLVPSVPALSLVAVGAQHACGVASATGEVWCWGDSTSAQTSVTGGSTPPVKVPGLTGVTALGAGGRHTCAVGPPKNPQTTSNVYCWGDNGSGQLGAGVVSGLVAQPQNVPGPNTYGQVVAGDDFTCGAIASTPSSNELYCWGAQDSCQIGSCGPTPAAAPVYNTNACDGMAAAGKHMCLYGDFGAGITVCWGDDGAGQSSGTPGTPKPMGGNIGSPDPFSTYGIGAGRNHSCGILASGVVRCWGDNSKGQRGLGTATFLDTTLPAAAKELALGDAHTCALAVDGQVYCWGDGTLGQLGDGVSSIRANPLPVQW